MICLTFEASMSSKVKDHFKKNWKVYAMGAGAVGTGIAAGEVADRMIKGDHITKDAVTAARTGGILGTGWAMKKKYDDINRSKKKPIKESFTSFKDKKAADVIEKTGGQKAVGHLRKHWKKYAALAGAGLVSSMAGEGMRLGASKKIGDALKSGETEKIPAAHRLLRKGEVVDTAGTATTIGAGAAAGAGKLYDRRKPKRA